MRRNCSDNRGHLSFSLSRIIPNRACSFWVRTDQAQNGHNEFALGPSLESVLLAGTPKMVLQHNRPVADSCIAACYRSIVTSARSRNVSGLSTQAALARV